MGFSEGPYRQWPKEEAGETRIVGRRREQRVVINLPVIVSGRDVDNNPFRQECETVDISRNGCQVRWLACLRGVGDTVEVQYEKEKARFKVTFIGKEGTKQEGHVGLRVLENKYLWGMALPSAKPDAYVVPEELPPPPPPEPVTPVPVSLEPSWRGQERRANPRHRCSGDVEALDAQTNARVRGMLSDIGVGGCYVDVISPFASGTEVRLQITASGTKIETSAVVRASHASMGMGLEFAEMSPENRLRLDALLAQLTGQAVKEAPMPIAADEADRYSLSESDLDLQRSSPPPPPPPPIQIPAQSFDNQVVLDTLLQLLYSKGVLSREEFLQALEKAASTSTTRRQ